MPTYLLTIQPDDFPGGLFAPGIRLSRFRTEAALKDIAPGRRIELRHPDGTNTCLKVKELTVDDLRRIGYSNADQATQYEFPGDPILRVRFDSTVSDASVPPGTTMWIVN